MREPRDFIDASLPLHTEVMDAEQQHACLDAFIATVHGGMAGS